MVSVTFWGGPTGGFSDYMDGILFGFSEKKHGSTDQLFLFRQELMPEGRSFDALGRPLEVTLAFQRQIDQEALARKLWQAAACGDVRELRMALIAYQDPDAQDEQGEFLGRDWDVGDGVWGFLGFFGRSDMSLGIFFTNHSYPR